MENNELMNLNVFREKLINKVRTEIANLIPDEKLDSFITTTIKKFEEEELENLVMNTLREHTKEEIKKMLQRNSYGDWNYEKNIYEMSPEIEKILIDAAPKMFSEIMRETAKMTIMNMGNNLY